MIIHLQDGESITVYSRDGLLVAEFDPEKEDSMARNKELAHAKSFGVVMKAVVALMQNVKDPDYVAGFVMCIAGSAGEIAEKPSEAFFAGYASAMEMKSTVREK